jgi:GGDEF domain-containing protein
LLQNEAITLDNQPLVITCSIGVAEKTAAVDKSTLLHNADLALYQAKREGRNCVRVFNPDAVCIDD